METIEYRDVVDKTDWERGEWDHEPDKVQWQDEATGLPCLIVRGPSGALCGYVGVPVGHPWHGTDYDDCGLYHPKPDDYAEDWYIDVHGGLTYAGGCQHPDNQADGICHIPGDGEPDDTWWLGFDCAHFGDYTDMARPKEWRDRWPSRDSIYRDIAYVRSECQKLAKQAASVSP